ncbi:hypothetical protein COL32_08905 [Bacillus pseudomycoides]|uniref:hypothetical protein n=1 Tax=Bacillus pseudomycoides TaxID=64104 RepID=UPI000BF2B7B7|nr:hypothetical protein [Bacillus pseudomycoides]PFW91329.1 hypothetical protein COL29_19000 [Bacillus pseudomycoides]PFX46030.1 hypothetical protein COL32_08905 [Bacillus pseudomycoides]
MGKLTEREFKSIIEYYEREDKHGKVFLLNSLFETLSKEESLTKTGERTTTHVDVAYSYLYLITWLYRNAKYGVMSDQNTDVGTLKELIGFTSKEKRINYIIKKNGILDQLGLTKTIPYKEAPYSYTIDDDNVIDFETITQAGIKVENNRKTIKEPIFGLYDSDGEYGYGTFFGGVDSDNISKTHNIDFKIFIKCMTNKNLGTDAFYIYSFLKSKCDVAGGTIEIAHDTIMKQTGITRGKMNIALDGLKKHGLIKCFPATYVINSEADGASVYSCQGIGGYSEEEMKYITRNVTGVKEDKKEEVK